MNDDKNPPPSTIERFLYGKASEQEQDDMQSENNYRLYTEKPHRMLRLIRDNGSYYSVHYSDIYTIEGEANGEYLSILFKGGRMWCLEGKHLHRLADAIEDWRAHRLYVYNSNIHRLRDPGDPIITRIIEELPPKRAASTVTTPLVSA